MLRSFSKTPLQLPREELNILKSLQPILHRLYDSIALDKHFIVNAFKPMTAECEWIKQEIAVYERCHRAQELKPRLSLPNFVYMAHNVCMEDGDEDSVTVPYTLSVSNVQAGGPFQAELVRSFQHATMDGGPMLPSLDRLGAHGSSKGSNLLSNGGGGSEIGDAMPHLEDGPLSVVCATLAAYRCRCGWRGCMAERSPWNP